MSLRDTIEAARQEAQDAGSIFVSKGREKAEEGTSSEQESTGFSKRSTARAKPKSAAASSVRTVSAEDARAGRSGKKSREMSKEERKAERQRQRDIDDRRNTVGNILLKRDEAYSRTQVVWWVSLSIGLALTLVSFGINWMMSQGMITEANSGIYATIALVSLVFAYVFIIGAFVYDLIKARPIRKQVEQVLNGMSVKKMDQIIREDAEEKAAKKAKK